MKNITNLIIALYASMLFAQAPVIAWQKNFGGSSFDRGSAIDVTSDGGYIIAGETQSNNGDVTINYGSMDVWVVKLTANGTIEWQKSLGGSSDEWAESILQTHDGGYVFAGTTLSNNGDVSGNHGSTDYWIVKLNANGSIAWQKTYGGSSIDNARKIIQTNDNGFIVVGHSSSNDGNVTGNHGNNDYWVLKLDSNGNLQWQKSLGGSSLDIARSVEQLTDGYLVAGWTSSNDGDVTGLHGAESDYWIVKLDLNGNLVWQKTLGGNSHDYAYSIVKTTDGGCIVAGMSTSNDGNVTGNHDADYWIVKLDTLGDIQWQKCYGGGDTDSAREIIEVNGGYVIIGYSLANTGDVSFNHGGWDFWIVKIDTSGNLVWEKSLGGSANEEPLAIQATSDGGYILTGYTFSNDGDVSGNHGMSDCWIIKLGTDSSLGNSEININKSVNIFPNPASEILHINFPENENMIGIISVFDISGKMLFTSTIQSKNIELKIDNWNSGLYFLKYTGENKQQTFKFIKK